MKNQLLLELLKKKTLSIPLFLYQLKDKMKIEGEEFIFFMYLYNEGEKFLFDPKAITRDLGVDLGAIMSYISSLSEKDLISVIVEKNDKNIREEYISLESFYNKLSIWIKDEIEGNTDNNSGTDTDIYSFIEKEFGRTISPSEYQVIQAWLGDDISEELVKEAVTEAVLNGVSSIRYIDKILYEWKKKNIKTKEDVSKERERFRNRKDSSSVEVFEYDWLDDDED